MTYLMLPEEKIAQTMKNLEGFVLMIEVGYVVFDSSDMRLRHMQMNRYRIRRCPCMIHVIRLCWPILIDICSQHLTEVNEGQRAVEVVAETVTVEDRSQGLSQWVHVFGACMRWRILSCAMRHSPEWLSRCHGLVRSEIARRNKNTWNACLTSLPSQHVLQPATLDLWISWR